MTESTVWYVIQTNPQCEAKAASEIRRAGFRAYLPMAAREFRHHRTKQPGIKWRPALIGYLFLRFPDGKPNWYALRQCQGVRGVLYSDGLPYELPHREVAAIIRAQRSTQFDTADARSYRLSRRRGEHLTIARAVARERFKPGMAVRANTGPWAQMLARIEAITERGTIKAITSLFGRQTAVEFSDVADLEVLDEKAEAA